ncbi:MAG: KH domain-containing protein [Actinomycetes bacterium]
MSDYVEGDINTIESDDEVADDSQGNVASDPMAEAVLTYLAKSLTRDPEAVVVEAEERGNQIRLRLHVGPDDMGRVIGRRGRTAQAIRALVAVAGARTETATNVDIVDD